VTWPTKWLVALAYRLYRRHIDSRTARLYIRSMTLDVSDNRIQIGQVWERLDNRESFLVTRLYSEALSTFAILRPSGAETAALLKVKVEQTAAGQTLPGFSLAHGLEA
jgi:hypothetical protein